MQLAGKSKTRAATEFKKYVSSLTFGFTNPYDPAYSWEAKIDIFVSFRRFFGRHKVMVSRGIRCCGD